MNIIKTAMRIGSLGVCTSIIVLALSGQAHAISDIDLGMQAKNDNDYLVAVSHFQKAAQAGSHEAQYQLGLLYAQGSGIAKDLTEATNLIQKAADQGHLLATAWLSQKVVSTPTTEEDPEEEPEDDC